MGGSEDVPVVVSGVCETMNRDFNRTPFQKPCG